LPRQIYSLIPVVMFKMTELEEFVMMKLSTMRKVVATVDAEWRSSFAEKILERWGYDEGTVYYFRASANFLFIFKKEGKTYFLRFNDASEKELSTIDSELKILEYLRNQPVHVALPIKSLAGNFIEIVEHELGTFYAVVFEALPGKQFEIEDLGMSEFFEWGRTLGKLHQLFKEMPSEYQAARASWRDQLSAIERHLPPNEVDALKELAEIKLWAMSIPETSENVGLIHFDFELDNLRWINGEFAVLDFDDCLRHWYVADIAFALRDVLKNGYDPENALILEFIKGYQKQTVLNANSIKELPMFIRMHNLVTFSGLLRTVDIKDSTNLPEWLGNLKNKLEAYIDHYRSTFK
jgi:Ser/Thr protein kinase RdoA (MazF antagonist)